MEEQDISEDKWSVLSVHCFLVLKGKKFPTPKISSSKSLETLSNESLEVYVLAKTGTWSPHAQCCALLIHIITLNSPFSNCIMNNADILKHMSALDLIQSE